MRSVNTKRPHTPTSFSCTALAVTTNKPGCQWASRKRIIGRDGLQPSSPRVNAWSLQYPSAISRWRGHSMPIPQRARNILTELEQNDIGGRPIIFLCHSLGGLVVKKALNLASAGQSSAVSVLGNVRGIVFMGTPSAGVSIARWIVRTRLALSLVGAGARLSSLVAEMQRADPYLLELRDWYADNAGRLGIANLVLYETKAVRGIIKVAEADSADLGIGGVERIPLDADHFELCKFGHRRETGYCKIISFIREALARPSPLYKDGSNVPKLGSADLINTTSPPISIPGPVADFTGRAAEIAKLVEALSRNNCRAVIASIGGMGGVGKTALAVEVASAMAKQFPDGIIYINLQGFAQAAPLTPVQAISAVIGQLDPTAPPSDRLDQLHPRYRSLLSGRRLLLLLDNAREAAQIADLIPPRPVALLVTSRHQIYLDGAVQLDLGTMQPQEARDLLRGIVGAARGTDDDLTLIAERCGHLPLALRSAGAYLRYHQSLAPSAYLRLLAMSGKGWTTLPLPRPIGMSAPR